MTGPPCTIWRAKISATLSREASTLPSRRTLPPDANTICSATLLVAPITEAGATDLSVESSTTRAPCSVAIRVKSLVAKILLAIAASGCPSISGTCLKAAAWKTICGAWVARISSSSASSDTLPRIGDIAHAAPEFAAEAAAQSRSRAKRLLSEASRRTSFAGPSSPKRIANAEPMDPPAPVIRIVCRRSRSSASGAGDGSRGRARKLCQSMS